MRISGGVLLGRIIHLVIVLGQLEFLVQAEAQTILALVPHRKIRENEVAGWLGAIQVNHSGDGSSGQYGRCSALLWHAPLGNVTGIFQRGKQKIISVHVEGNVLGLVALALQDTELYNGRRVYRTAVRRSCGVVRMGVVSRQSGLREAHIWHPDHMLSLAAAAGGLASRKSEFGHRW